MYPFRVSEHLRRGRGEQFPQRERRDAAYSNGKNRVVFGILAKYHRRLPPFFLMSIPNMGNGDGECHNMRSHREKSREGNLFAFLLLLAWRAYLTLTGTICLTLGARGALPLSPSHRPSSNRIQIEKAATFKWDFQRSKDSRAEQCCCEAAALPRPPTLLSWNLRASSTWIRYENRREAW